MASYFRQTRDTELSIIYYLSTEIASSWSGITVVKAFTDAYKAELPVVAIRLKDTVDNYREIGGTTLYSDYSIVVDIFATSDGQRLDLADFIMDKLKDGCVYYEHSQTSGAPETLSRTANGRLHVNQFISNMKIDFGEEGVDKYDKFRHYLEIRVRKD